MRDYWIQFSSSLAVGLLVWAITPQTGIDSLSIRLLIAVPAAGLCYLLLGYATQHWRYGDRINRKGPIQVYLPDWDKNDSDFNLDGKVQKEGFLQGQKEAEDIHDALAVDFHKFEENTPGSHIIKQMKDNYKERGSLYFIMTMSGKVLEMRKEFMAWHDNLRNRGKLPPVLIVTVASAPDIADDRRGILRWYIRSQEESKELANHLDRKGIKKCAVFAIARTPNMDDDIYGREGTRIFCNKFNQRQHPSIPSDLRFFVTSKTADCAVAGFLKKYPNNACPGIFIIGYGKMVKNTLTALIEGGYEGEIVCTSTLTDPQWRPSQELITKSKANIWTIQPQLSDHNHSLIGQNRNVVFLFARKTIIRVLRLTAGDVDPVTFMQKWEDGESYEEPHRLGQDTLEHGDTLFYIDPIKAKDLE